MIHVKSGGGAGGEISVAFDAAHKAVYETKRRGYIEIYESGTLTFPFAKPRTIDIFCIGGGGGCGSAGNAYYYDSTGTSTRYVIAPGGGSGYTDMKYSVNIMQEDEIPVIIGAGGYAATRLMSSTSGNRPGTDGGATSCLTCVAGGGKRGARIYADTTYNEGGAGGDGGSGGASAADVGADKTYANTTVVTMGGTDGGDGSSHTYYYPYSSSGLTTKSGTAPGGKGQGTTTADFFGVTHGVGGGSSTGAASNYGDGGFNNMGSGNMSETNIAKLENGAGYSGMCIIRWGY